MLVLLGPSSAASNDSPPGKTLLRGRCVEDDTDENTEIVASAYHMVGFYVAPEHRGHGIGGALIRTAMEVIANDRVKIPTPKAVRTVGASHKFSRAKAL
jgi:ribosomal protein S18 acetylase RimI-like enzyme